MLFGAFVRGRISTRDTRVYTRSMRYLQRPSKSEANSLCAGPPVVRANERTPLYIPHQNGDDEHDTIQNER